MSKDYAQAKIYQIKVNTDEEYLPYIGSTCKNYLSQRMSYHHQDYKKYKKNPEKYDYISSFILFDKFGFENCFIELLELVSCNCNDELKKKEREWIEKINCCNKVKRPFVTKEEKIIKGKEYREKNIDKKKEKNKEYREKNIDKIKEKNKEYREKNKDIIKEKDKEYYKKNKDTIKEQRKTKITCECGSIICHSELSRHKKSLKHISYIQSLN